VFCIPPGSLGVITERLEFSPVLVPPVVSNITGVVIGLPLLVVSIACVDNSKVLFELFSMMFGVDFTIKSVVCDTITPEVVSMVVEGGDVGITL
jgi:hypothetical protein